jgi:hypothetical protein
MRRPLQVYLDAADIERLDTWARAHGWTNSQAVRIAIRALTRPSTDDPILDLSGDLDGLPSDLSANFDRYLNETYVAERPTPSRTRQRQSRPPVRR